MQVVAEFSAELLPCWRTVILFDCFVGRLPFMIGDGGEFLADESDIGWSGGAMGLQDVELKIFKQMCHAVFQKNKSFHKYPHI